MKIRINELKQIIKEEIQAVLEEQRGKRRGLFRQIFRMDHPKVDAIQKRFADDVSKIQAEFYDVGVGVRSFDAYSDLLTRLGQAHSNYLNSFKAASGFDASKDQHARSRQITKSFHKLYDEILADSEREAGNARARRALEREREAKAERERLEREAASSSGAGFDQKAAHDRCREEHKRDLRRGYDEGFQSCLKQAREFAAKQQRSRYEE